MANPLHSQSTSRLLARLVLAVAAVCATSSAAFADEMEVILRCSPTGYPAATAPVVACDTAETCFCRVYWANLGVARTNVDFTIHSSALPDVALTGDWETDGDTTLDLLGLPIPTAPVITGWLTGNGWSSDKQVLHRTMMGNFQPAPWAPPAGYTFLPGSDVPTAHGNISLPLRLTSLGAGQTGQFEFNFTLPPAFAPVGEVGAVTVTTAHGATTMAPPVAVATMTRPFVRTNMFDFYGASMSALVTTPIVKGTSTIGPRLNSGGGSVYTSSEHALYLPYWDADDGQIRGDADYDPLNGDEIIVDLTQLNATGTINSGWHWSTDPDVLVYELDATIHTDLAVPDGTYNTNEILFVEAGTNKLTLRTGYIGHYWSTILRYDAPLLPEYDYLRTVNATITTTRCARVYEDPTYSMCGPAVFTYLAVPPFTSGNFSLSVSNSSNDSVPGVGYGAEAEAAALRRNGILKTVLGTDVVALALLVAVDDVTLQTQIAGSDSGPFGDTTVGKDFDLQSFRVTDGGWGIAGVHNPHELWVSNAAGDYDDDTDLTTRTLLANGDVSWRLCASGIGSNVICDAAAMSLAGIPFGIDAVTYVKAVIPTLAAISPGIENRARMYMEVTQVKTSTLRGSVDQSPVSFTNALRAAAGVRAQASISVDGIPSSVSATRSIENDPRLRTGIGIMPHYFWATMESGNIFDNVPFTLGQERDVGCSIYATREASIHLPATWTIDLPDGFEPIDPNPATAVIVSTTGGALSGRTSNVTWDGTLRRYMVVVDADQDLVGQQMNAGPYELGVKFTGAFAPGAPEHPIADCRVTGVRDDENGNPTAFDYTTATGYRLQGAYPVLTLGTSAAQPTIPRHGNAVVNVVLDNEVFDDTSGVAIPAGARAAAREAVVAYRVPREGDFPSEENGVIAVSFGGASSPDASQIYVSNVDNPTRTSGDQMPTTSGWTLCSESGPCDTAAMALAGIDPLAVRWVAFRMPRAEMTDASPRSPNPGPGVGHVDVPYVLSVVLHDEGSVGEAGLEPKLIGLAEVRSLDTATPIVGSATPVTIDLDCDADVDNAAPTAVAMADEGGPEGMLLTLDGRGSSDPEDATLTYAWVQTAGPTVVLIGANTALPTFEAPAVGTNGDPLASEVVTFELTVTDAAPTGYCGPLASDVTTVSLDLYNMNTPAVADAGPDQIANAGTVVALDGSGSNDPDGDDFTYSWFQTEGPTVILNGDDTAAPTFTAPIVGLDGEVLVFVLCVADPYGEGSSCDDVQITVNTACVPEPESCDGADNDCDGTADNDVAPETTPCTLTGGCAGVITSTCQAGEMVSDGVCALAQPVVDDCDGIDNDCDQLTDEGWTASVIDCGQDACAVGQGTTTCIGGEPGDTCDALWNDIPDTTCGVGTTGMNVAYIIVTNDVGTAIGSLRCYQDLSAVGTPVRCDTEPDSSELVVYPELLCEGVAP